MAKRATICAVAALKGGCGKSSYNIMLADYLYNAKNKKVLLIDCDDDQHSISHWREFEKSTGVPEDKLYPILSEIDSADVASQIRALIDHYDYIIIDLPGNLKQKGVKTVYALMDVVFVPTQVDYDTLKAHTSFLNKMDEVNADRVKTLKQNSTKYYGFLARVNPRMTNVKNMVNNLDGGFDDRLPMLETVIPVMNKEYQQKVTTLGYRNKSKYGHKFKMLSEEMLTELNKLKNKAL